MSDSEMHREVDHDAVVTAWHIHSVIVDWTKNVDTKASFISALETAVVLGVLASSGDEGQLSDLEGWWELGLFWLGVALVVMSLLAVLSVVTPHLRGRASEDEHPENFIFFGHAQHWDPARLAESLRTTDVLPVLSRQIVTMSKIAWFKHRRLQMSVIGACAGVGLIAISALVNFAR